MVMAMGQKETSGKATPVDKAEILYHQGGDYWVFFGELKRKDGTRRQIFLFNAASVRIRRHCKIKGAANPYDSAMETYFERRLDAQMSTTLQGH
jgi:RNA-directed DNA polymerase